MLSTENILSEMREKFGLFPKIGVEHEYYLQGDEDAVEQTIREVLPYLDRFEREKGWQQFENIFEYTGDLKALSVRAHKMKSAMAMLARKNGVKLTFEAKPHKDDYGSALHFHISLHDVELDHNAFSDGAINDNTVLQRVISSLLVNTFKIMKATCLRPMDFDRFRAHCMAPTHISWGGNNRTTIIRVPDSPPENRRIEYRLFPASADFDIALNTLLYYTYLGLSIDLPEFERIYGNAHDMQYSLAKIPTSMQELDKLLKT